MDAKVFQRRAKQMALRVINLVEALPNTAAGQVSGKQILRSATSVGANYRAASRAKSSKDMLNKLKIVEEEADETLYWLELIVKSELMTKERVQGLMQEVNEILSMTVASIKTLRRKSSIVNR